MAVFSVTWKRQRAKNGIKPGKFYSALQKPGKSILVTWIIDSHKFIDSNDSLNISYSLQLWNVFLVSNHDLWASISHWVSFWKILMLPIFINHTRHVWLRDVNKKGSGFLIMCPMLWVINYYRFLRSLFLITPGWAWCADYWFESELDRHSNDMMPISRQ